VSGLHQFHCTNTGRRKRGGEPVVDLKKGEVNFEADGRTDPNDLKTAADRLATGVVSRLSL